MLFDSRFYYYLTIKKSIKSIKFKQQKWNTEKFKLKNKMEYWGGRNQINSIAPPINISTSTSVQVHSVEHKHP